jgi:putative transposase
MVSAILSVLRTGIQWNALPRERGASTTVSDRFRLWEEQGVCERIWQAGFQEYDEREGIAWEWQRMDGVMTTAPFGGAATGAHPTDRGKRGTTRSHLSDGRGLPLALVVAGANRNDRKLAETTLDHLMIARPTPTEEEPQHLCVDAGSDDDTVFETVRAHQSVPHIRPNQHNRAAHAKRAQESEVETSSSLESTKLPRRWVVERLHSWITRSRRLLVRWEKLDFPSEAFFHLACGLICFQHCDRFRSLQVSE